MSKLKLNAPFKVFLQEIVFGDSLIHFCHFGKIFHLWLGLLSRARFQILEDEPDVWECSSVVESLPSSRIPQLGLTGMGSR